MCGVAEYPVTTIERRGVWHSHPTTRNEAAGESGKQGLISLVHLHLLSDSENLFGPLVAALCFLFFRVTFSTLEGSRVHCEPKLMHDEPYPSRNLPVVLER